MIDGLIMKMARRLHNLGIEGEKASNTMGLAVIEGRHLETLSTTWTTTPRRISSRIKYDNLSTALDVQ